MSFEKRCQLEFCASKCKTKKNLFLKRHLDNLTNTSMACQGLCSKIMQNYAENLPQKLKHQKQFALFETCHQHFILHYFKILHSSNKAQHIKKMKPDIFPNKQR